MKIVEKGIETSTAALCDSSRPLIGGFFFEHMPAAVQFSSARNLLSERATTRRFGCIVAH
eukprot:scaffold621790_cov15-Prasinocladus_malaysianus.AAC.1